MCRDDAPTGMIVNGYNFCTLSDYFGLHFVQNRCAHPWIGPDIKENAPFQGEHHAGYLSAVRSGVAATGSGKAEQFKSESKLKSELEPNGTSGQNDEC